MKNQFTIFILFLVLFVSKTGTAQTSNWKWQNPLPQGNNLAEIHVFDENTAIAVGNIGTIIKTTNGGISWDMKESNTQEYLNSVFFINNNTGWAVGNNKVLLKTTDGGTSWTTIIIDPDPTSFWNLYSIFFIDENTGWMTGSTTHTYKTTDGGMTWSFLNFAPEYGGADIQFIDQNNGWMVSGGTVYRTTTGGQYWDLYFINFNNPGDYPYAIHFIDANTGWVVGGNPANGGGLISKTIDGGVTWTVQSSGITESLYSVYFTNPNTGWAVGNDKILNTIDGGANWVVQTLLIPENSIVANSVKFTNDSTGFVVGNLGAIYKTTNTGIDWVSQRNSVVPYNNRFEGLDFINETTGFAVGILGSIVKTTDGGNNWTVKNSGLSVPLYNVDMIDSLTGWVTGGSGKIIKTTDGGNTWIEQSSGVTNILYGLHFPVDSSTGWVTGTGGRILKTTDGGANWTIQASGVTGSIRTVYFIDNNTGFTATAGKVLKTINGGTTWTSLTIASSTLILNSIYFTNPTTGWIVGASGKIFNTTDSGITWQEKTSGVGWALYSVKSTPNSVIVVGNGGIMLKSTDGGENWIPQNSKTYNLLYSVDLINDSTIWAVGTNGTILHTGVQNPIQTLPLAFNVTGTGSYCQGSGGLEVGLNNSETGVTYTLFKNAVAQVPTVDGTGSAISFGLQTEGTYTVEGTNSAGTTVMIGSSIITETDALPVSVSVETDLNNVCTGTQVTLTATPVNGGNPSYQWYLNGSPTGANQASFTYVPQNNDQVYVVITSDLACVSGNPATSNTIELIVNELLQVSVGVVTNDNNVCSGTEVTLTANPVNGGSPAFQWYKNAAPAGTNQATFSYTPENNDQVYVVMTSDLGCVSDNPATSNTISMLVNDLLPVNASIVADQNDVCVGTQVIFTATPVNGGNPSYQWYVNGSTVGNDQDTFTYTPTDGDQVYVVLTSDLGCVSDNPATSNTISMLVNDLLTVNVSIVADQNDVCDGTQVTFTATPVNGGNPSYQWYVNGSTVGSDQDTFTYTPADGEQVYVVMTSDLGCVSDNPATSNTVTMIVNDILPVSVSLVADQNNVCEGTIVSFFPIPVEGGSSPTYEWYVSGTFAANGDTYSYVPSDGDQVYVIMTSSLACVSGNPAQSNTLLMQVSPYIDVTASIAITQNNLCEGSEFNFTSSTTGGGNTPQYQWQVNGATTGENTPEFAYVAENGDVVSMVFTSDLTCTNGNPVTSNTITAVVNPLPIVTWPGFEPDTLCIEDWGPVTLTGGTPAGGTYSGDGVVDNLFDPAQAGTGTHEITYTYSDPNGCSNQSALVLFVDVCLGMSEMESGLLVYPNPVSDNLMVKMQDNSTLQQITLTNMLGIRVYQIENPDSNEVVSIPVQNLPSGNYLLRVISESKFAFKMVVIK